jgi:putative phage-type endonuclease
MATTAIGLTQKQRALRAEGLGASEVPTALGLNPFQSAAELAAVKRGELPAFEGNEFTRWGQRLERPIADEWLERHAAEGVSIFTPGTLRHRTSPVLLASPDRVIVPAGRRAREAWLGLLEIKATSVRRADAFGEAADDIPETFIVQTQVQMEVCDIDSATLVPLIGGNDYREYPQRRDREMGGNLVQFAEKWWADYVVQGLPVPLDGSEAASSYLRRRFPVEHGPLLDPTDAARDLVQAFRLAKERLAESEEAASEIGNRLRALIGEASGVAGLCTWKANRPSEKTDWEEAVADAKAVLMFEASPDERKLTTREVIQILDAAVKKRTTTKPGARVLRLAKEG